MAPARDDLSHIHRPVMVPEVLGYLLGDREAASSLFVVDGTVGLGGHAEAVLQADERVRVLGLDRDAEALERAQRRLASFGDARFQAVHASYADLEAVLESTGWGAPDGVFLDLGVSSLQLDDADRGFSFRVDAAGADMRFDRSSEAPTALDLVNRLSEKELSRILHEYGEEPRSRVVARELVRARPVSDGEALVAIVRRFAWRTRRHDPATRTFQALRIAVNEEFEHLERGLVTALAQVVPGGRVVVLAFHSGEDRRVKEAFRGAAREGVGRLLTRKPERPTEEEVRGNPRSRSARLRAFEKGSSGEREPS